MYLPKYFWCLGNQVKNWEVELEEISEKNGYSDWNTYVAYLKNIEQPTKNIDLLRYMAGNSGCKLYSLIADEDPIPVVNSLTEENRKNSIMHIVYDQKDRFLEKRINSHFRHIAQLIPVTKSLSWGDAMRGCERYRDGVFLFNPPIELENELYILSMCRPTFIIQKKSDYYKLKKSFVSPVWKTFRCSFLREELESS